MTRTPSLLAAAALLASCSGAARVPPSARPAASSSAAPLPAPPASAAHVAEPDVPEPLADSAGAPEPDIASGPPPEPAPTVPSDAALPAYIAHPVAFERPYKLGLRTRFKDKEFAKDDDQELARWNEGGRRGTWHPQPRVMVDNVRVQGKVSSAAVLRQARKNGYWPIRKCYDAALPADQELRGKVTLRLTLRSSGKVGAVAVAGSPTLPSKPVIACLRKALRGLELVRTRKGDAKVTLDVGLNPGDAPMKPEEDPPPTAGPGVLDPAVVQAIVAASAGAQAQLCYEQGLARVPGLWGRLALRADIAADGSILSLVETESTFPDPATTACVTDAVRAVRLPVPRQGDLRLVIPIRMGIPQ